MPNSSNIEAPVTLISYGRSGSSLLSKIFELHPEFSVAGETGNLTFDLWKAYDFSSGVITPEQNDWVPDNERAGRMVRASFMSCFADNKQQWFHKPIGVPTMLSAKFNEDEWDKSASWYWNVINSTFPKARFFTLLRHPFDVVLSAKSYWSFDEASIWWNYAYMSYLLLHPLCPIKYAISYEEMLLDPETTTKSLFDFLEVPFHEEVMQAFTNIHAASKDRDQLTSNQFTRKDEWSQLNKGEINPKYLDIILKLFNKYNKNIELSDSTYENISQKFHKKELARWNVDSTNNLEIQKLISEHNEKIEFLNSENSKMLRKRDKEYNQELMRIKEEYDRMINNSRCIQLIRLLRKINPF